MSLFGDLIIMNSLLVPVTISTDSPFSLGDRLAAHQEGAPVETNPWPSANLAIFVPFILPTSATVVKLFCRNGTTLSGNIDMGIYDEAGARKVSIGSTAQAALRWLQVFDIADTTLIGGRYYLTASMDNATGEVFQWFVIASYLRAWGCAQMAAAFPLPATATLATMTQTYLPFLGLSLRTLV